MYALPQEKVIMIRGLKLSLGLGFVLLFPAPLVRESSENDLKKQIEELSQAVKAMQKDLQEIKALLLNLAPPAPPENVVLDLTGNYFRGERTARLTLVEFSDYQCPFCARYVRETAPLIGKEYIESGKIRQVFLNFPLESIHKLAFKAAEVANCAGEQGKYWEMHDRLFANQQAFEPWTAHTQAVGLDLPKFEECLNSGRQAAQIRKDLAQGEKAGVTGTPTFFLAYTDPKSSQVKTLIRLTGAQPFVNFKAAIDKVVAGQPEPARKN
jgi:protein-disulfide isomerase